MSAASKDLALGALAGFADQVRREVLYATDAPDGFTIHVFADGNEVRGDHWTAYHQGSKPAIKGEGRCPESALVDLVFELRKRGWKT